MAQPIAILIVGGGGREHALAWRLRRENPNARIIAAPGNPGIASLAECVNVGPTNVDGLLALAKERAVDWTLVGPEAALEAGIADRFSEAGQAIFGPTRAAAMIETSKEYSKTLMAAAGVPTAAATICTSVADANRAIEAMGAPVVIKASGLAAGKGVSVCATVDEARQAAASMLEDNLFGDAGATILIEEFMRGEELSVFAITDGEHAAILPPAQDHKRLLEGDRGPNTGGMGAYCPVSIADGLIDDVVARVIRPTLGAMQSRGTPFKGLLYAGLMLTPEGPKVVEFNCRFGDPETQAVLAALADDVRIGDLLRTVATGGRLEDVVLRASHTAVTTVMAASGYPERPATGDAIRIPETPADVLVFHAGTTLDGGTLRTSGGRVLAVTGVADGIEAAKDRSLSFAERIEFAGKQYRSDIASRELARRARTS